MIGVGGCRQRGRIMMLSDAMVKKHTVFSTEKGKVCVGPCK